MSQIIFGVDPGLDGAIIGIDAQGVIVVRELMPIVGIKGKNRRAYDLPSITAIFHGLEDIHVWMEALHANPVLGSVTSFSLGYCTGIFQGIFTALNIPYDMVPPKRWQGVMFDGVSKEDTKQASVLIAKRLQPNVDWRATERAKKPNDNLTDAYLIAEFGRRKKQA